MLSLSFLLILVCGMVIIAAALALLGLWAWAGNRKPDTPNS